MLSREELKLLNEILQGLDLENEKNKLKEKLSLICEQLVIMEKSQEEVAKIQDKIVALEGDKNENKEN